MFRLTLIFAALIALNGPTLVAQDKPVEETTEDPAATTTDDQKDADASQKELFDKFAESMSGVRMIGRFTVTGKDDDKLQKDEYIITSVSKLPSGDLWLFQTRIKYGDHDVNLPVPVPVKWADQTPVITVDNLTIPGLGTFGARVVIDGDKYAGTWSHGDVGGHMFGEIKKLEPDELRKEKENVEN
jgi:hypothetical protein